VLFRDVRPGTKSPFSRFVMEQQMMDFLNPFFSEVEESFPFVKTRLD